MLCQSLKHIKQRGTFASQIFKSLKHKMTLQHLQEINIIYHLLLVSNAITACPTD